MHSDPWIYSIAVCGQDGHGAAGDGDVCCYSQLVDRAAVETSIPCA